MNAAWGGIVGPNEIIICLSSHKTTDNILYSKAFSVSVADAIHEKACDYVELVSAKDEPRKMEKAGFTTTRSPFVNAPIINELPLALECRLIKAVDGKIYGEIVNVSADERILGADGEISLDVFSPITYDGVHRGYYALGKKVGTAFHDGNALKCPY